MQVYLFPLLLSPIQFFPFPSPPPPLLPLLLLSLSFLPPSLPPPPLHLLLLSFPPPPPHLLSVMDCTQAEVPVQSQWSH